MTEDIKVADVGQVIKQFTTHDAEYKELVQHMQKTLVARLAADGNALFRTKTQMGNKEAVVAVLEKAGEDTSKLDLPVALNQVYLGSLTDEVHYHTCSCCATFMRNFGGLVTIDDEGKTHSAVRDADTFPRENFYFQAVHNLQAVVERGVVIGAHRSDAEVYGEFVSGNFEHFAVVPPEALHYERADKTARQYQAVLKEDYVRMAEYFATEPGSMRILTALNTLLDSEALKGAEKIYGPGKWLYHTALARVNSTGIARNNLLWKAVALAGAGFTHPGSTMAGTVIEDIMKGVSFSAIQRKYAAKIKPTVYQQPTAPASTGAIDAAEKLVVSAGLAPALERRVATFEDILPTGFVWQPTPREGAVEGSQGSVFGHLKAKAADAPTEIDLKIPPAIMSWNKFVDTILAEAQEIEIFIPPTRDGFTGLMTAVHADAPPILQWDHLEARNPVSSYIHAEKDARTGAILGVFPHVWNLESGYYPVTAVIRAPNEWTAHRPVQSIPQLLFVIKGAYDRNFDTDRTGLAIFPEILRSDLHSIARVIKMHSDTGLVQGDPKEQVAGLSLLKGAAGIARVLRVKTATSVRNVAIDRWE